MKDCPCCGGKVDRQETFDFACTNAPTTQCTCTMCGLDWFEDGDEDDSTQYELKGGDYHG
jgi:hypothetical protein